jgi:hypothetical protein
LLADKAVLLGAGAVEDEAAGQTSAESTGSRGLARAHVSGPTASGSQWH